MVVPIDRAHAYFLSLQTRIVEALEQAGGTPFLADDWLREEGGGGLSRYLEDAPLFERAGVLFSHVRGNTLPPPASAHRPDLDRRAREALGGSLGPHQAHPPRP